MPSPTPTQRQAPATTSFDQGSHHELRAPLSPVRQAIPQITPENAQATPTIEPQKHDHDRSKIANQQPQNRRPRIPSLKNTMSNNKRPSGRASLPACERGGVIGCGWPACQTIYAELMTGVGANDRSQSSPLIRLEDLGLTWPGRHGHSAPQRRSTTGDSAGPQATILSGEVAGTISSPSFATMVRAPLTRGDVDCSKNPGPPSPNERFRAT